MKQMISWLWLCEFGDVLRKEDDYILRRTLKYEGR